jgi:hypothetical protein
LFITATIDWFVFADDRRWNGNTAAFPSGWLMPIYWILLVVIPLLAAAVGWRVIKAVSPLRSDFHAAWAWVLAVASWVVVMAVLPLPGWFWFLKVGQSHRDTYALPSLLGAAIWNGLFLWRAFAASSKSSRNAASRQ